MKQRGSKYKAIYTVLDVRNDGVPSVIEVNGHRYQLSRPNPLTQPRTKAGPYVVIQNELTGSLFRWLRSHPIPDSYTLFQGSPIAKEYWSLQRLRLRHLNQPDPVE